MAPIRERLHLGNVAGGNVGQGLTLRRGEVFRFFAGDFLGVVEPAYPDKLGAVGVDPGGHHRDAQPVMQRPDVLVEDLQPGVHHAPIDGVDA